MLADAGATLALPSQHACVTPSVVAGFAMVCQDCKRDGAGNHHQQGELQRPSHTCRAMHASPSGFMLAVLVCTRIQHVIDGCHLYMLPDSAHMPACRTIPSSRPTPCPSWTWRRSWASSFGTWRSATRPSSRSAARSWRQLSLRPSRPASRSGAGWGLETGPRATYAAPSWSLHSWPPSRPASRGVRVGYFSAGGGLDHRGDPGEVNTGSKAV